MLHSYLDPHGHRLAHMDTNLQMITDVNRWTQMDTRRHTSTNMKTHEQEMMSYCSLIAHSWSLKAKFLKTWDLVRKCLILSTLMKNFIGRLLKCHLDVWNCYESSETISSIDNCIFLVFFSSRKAQKKHKHTVLNFKHFWSNRQVLELQNCFSSAWQSFYA